MIIIDVIVTHTYDENNNLVTVTDLASRVTTYTYDVNNRVVGVTKPDGSVTTNVYDSTHQRLASSIERKASGDIISGFEYTYDELSRVVEEKILAKSVKMCYTYDELSRVTKRTEKTLEGAVISEENFVYDAAGNVVSIGGTPIVYGTNNRVLRFNSNSVTYDFDGNMTSDGLHTYTYDSANRLTSFGGHTYTYTAENIRIRNLCSDEDTTYTYNTNCKLSQLLTKTTNGTVTKYVYGRGLIGEEVNNTFKTYHFDLRGSTVAITDQNGNITDTFAYDTYGKLISRTGTSNVIFLYNGRDGVVTDANGTYYMRARYYSPEMRRFVNADIVAGQISNAVTLNRFAYANGNPVSFVDPFGLSADDRGQDKENDEELAWFYPADQDNPYGTVVYNGIEYSIFVPNHLYKQLDNGWEIVCTKTDQEITFDWASFIVKSLTEVDDFNGTALGKSPYLPTAKQTHFAAATCVGLSLFTSAANSFESSYLLYEFQKKGDDYRVIINAGSSERYKLFNTYATGYWHSLRSNLSIQEGVYMTESLDNLYYRAGGGTRKFYESIDIRITIDKKHKGERFFSYIWMNEVGALMETPRIYPKDKVEIGRTILGFGFNRKRALVIDTPQVVSSDYSKMIKQFPDVNG